MRVSTRGRCSDTFLFQKQTQDSRFPALDHELGPTIRAWQHRRLTALLPVCAHFV